MKHTIKYILSSLLFCFFYLNCSSGSDGGDNGPDPDPTVIHPPNATTLIFPEQNSECTTGSNLTSTESTITFNWSDSNNTDSYQLFVKNLNTQSTQNYTSDVSEKQVTILRGTPYSWHVVSKNSGTTTAKSSTWKFYNAGEATVSYAPFPADLVAPALSETLNTSTTTTTLEWKGADVDNDIKEYDVLFGMTDPPTTKVVTTSETSHNVNISSGNTYYWQIITYDENNNNSESQVFKFLVE